MAFRAPPGADLPNLFPLLCGVLAVTRPPSPVLFPPDIMNYTISSPIYQAVDCTNIVPDIYALCLLSPIYIYDIINIIVKGVNLIPASKAQQKAVTKYMKENYDEIKVRVEKGRKADIKAHADRRGESVNSFIGRAIDETMERDTQGGQQNAGG